MAQKASITYLATLLPAGIARADVPDLAVVALAARLASMRRAVAGRSREFPEGIADVHSFYLLWDLPLPPRDALARWTSIRLSPQEAIELGRIQGGLNASFGSNRSEVFGLGLALLEQCIEMDLPEAESSSLKEMREALQQIYL